MGLEISISGGRNPESYEANTHAINYYEAVRRRSSDCPIISKNTGYNIEQISLVKEYIFNGYHSLNGRYTRFDPDYMMAESWRRLSSKNKSHIQDHDLILLRHELLEIQNILKGYSQGDAHAIAEQVYNYNAAATRFYRSQGFDLR